MKIIFEYKVLIKFVFVCMYIYMLIYNNFVVVLIIINV